MTIKPTLKIKLLAALDRSTYKYGGDWGGPAYEMRDTDFDLIWKFISELPVIDQTERDSA